MTQRATYLIILILLMSGLASAAPASAAEVYGIVTVAGSGTGAKAAVVQLDDRGTVEAGDTGAYRTVGIAAGWHRVAITYSGRRSEDVRIYVTGRTRANFELVNPKDKKKGWIVRRK